MRYLIVIIIILVLNVTAMAAESTPQEQTWAVATGQYEGFPFILRLPENLNYDKLKYSYPNLLTITHSFDKIVLNGMPEPDYNLSLSDFDNYLIEYFDKNKQGQIVMIETFRGKRYYYFYVAPSVNKEVITADIIKLYQNYKIIVEEKKDPEWKFIKRYSKKYRY